MDLLIGSLLLTAFILLLTYFLSSNKDNGDPSIPFAKHRSYPIIGHLFAFMNDRTNLLLECGQRYGSCFRIRVFNQQFTMILSHADWMNVVRNPSFKFMPTEFARKLFGISPLVADQVEFDADTHRLYVQYLKNRDGLHPMVVEFVRRVRELMKNEQEQLHKEGKTSQWISTDLFAFSHRMLYQPSTLALIGEIDPAALEKDFSIFDKNFHYFFIPFPDWFYSWFFSRELQARTRLNESWRKNQNLSTASEFHQARMALFDENSNWLSEKDYGAMFTGFFWASLGNTIPGVFWSLFYILRDGKALEIIQQEINTHLPKDENWNPEQLDACIYLESAINESIRLVGAPFMTRKCMQQVNLELQDGRTITLQSGEDLAWFGGASHYDPNLFSQPTSFVFDRFLNKKADTVVGYMPFGGGKSICPGRFFAKYEIKTTVAMLLRYMEYKFIDNKTIPTQLQPRIGVGIAPPTKDIPILYRYKV